MQQGCMCVAGIDLDTGLHVRPVLGQQLSIDLLSVHGGPFDIARVIELGQTRFAGKVPEVEDQTFDSAAARQIGDMPEGEFWSLLETHAQEKLGAIFGPDLERLGATCAVSETQGLRSLGCYWASAGKLFVEARYDRTRIRFAWQAGEASFNVPVTDIRLYADDHITPNESAVAWLAGRLAEQPRALVSVGLSRPYRKTADDPPRHWLQINNFHLPDSPCWTLEGGEKYATFGR
jgi:hypothetical protein